MSDTRTRVHEIISREMCLIDREVRDDATFAEMGCDSLDAMTLAMQIEDEFEVDVGDDIIITTATVGEAVAAVEQLLAQREGAI